MSKKYIENLQDDIFFKNNDEEETIRKQGPSLETEDLKHTKNSQIFLGKQRTLIKLFFLKLI